MLETRRGRRGNCAKIKTNLDPFVDSTKVPFSNLFQVKKKQFGKQRKPIEERAGGRMAEGGVERGEAATAVATATRSSNAT